jgi:hypothetical protein
MNGTGHDRCPSRLAPQGDQAPVPATRAGGEKIKIGDAVSRTRQKKFEVDSIRSLVAVVAPKTSADIRTRIHIGYCRNRAAIDRSGCLPPVTTRPGSGDRPRHWPPGPQRCLGRIAFVRCVIRSRPLRPVSSRARRKDTADYLFSGFQIVPADRRLAAPGRILQPRLELLAPD